MQLLFNRYFHIFFIGLFFSLSAFLLAVPPIWDEWVYLELASHILTNPLNPFHPMLSWVPHPPLMWYLLAIFHPLPRLTPLFISTICIIFLFYVCKRLYGSEVAKLSVVVLVSTTSYLFYSLVMFPDLPVASFMALSVISLLAWIKLMDQKFLLLSGLGLALASMTKYTSVPILLATFTAWIIVLRRRFKWINLFKMVVVIALSLLPLVVWSYNLSSLYGNIVIHYSSIYDIFLIRTSTLSTNLVHFTLTFFYFCGVPLISWIRKHPFNLDSKLLLIYSTITVLFLVFITPESAVAAPPYFRYSLPTIPAIAIISSRSLSQEKVSTRLLTLCFQFLLALFWLQPLF